MFKTRKDEMISLHQKAFTPAKTPNVESSCIVRRKAASNSAENFCQLYEGKPCLGKLTAQETALHEALGKLED